MSTTIQHVNMYYLFLAMFWWTIQPQRFQQLEPTWLQIKHPILETCLQSIQTCLNTPPTHPPSQVWNQVKLVVIDEVWPAVMSTCSKQHCHFSPDDVQYTLYYMAKLRFNEDRSVLKWLQEIAERLVNNMTTFHVANIVWSLAELGQRGTSVAPFVAYFMANLE